MGKLSTTSTYKPHVPTEAQDQEAVIAWWDMIRGRYPGTPQLMHIPNEAKRSYAEGKRQQRMGLRRGAPDLVLFAARGGWNGLAIELKRVNHSTKPTPEQIECLGNLANEHYKSVVCYGFDEAVKRIEDYMRGDHNA